MFPHVRRALPPFDSTPVSCPLLFARPLFSQSYELIIQIDTNCPGMYPLSSLCFVCGLCLLFFGTWSRKSLQLKPLQTLWHPPKSHPLCFQANPSSFAKNPGGGTPDRVALVPTRIRGCEERSDSVHRWQVAACRGGCHNTSLHTTRLGARAGQSLSRALLATRRRFSWG